jgi:DNA-binding transcriptional regulator YiaG
MINQGRNRDMHSIRWQEVDRWREDAGIPKAEFARRLGIPENTIYRGLKNNSKLQPSTVAVIRSVFPTVFEKRSGQ